MIHTKYTDKNHSPPIKFDADIGINLVPDLVWW